MKDVMVSQEDRLRPSDCRVQYCLFYNDRPKRFEDDEADRPDNFGGNYIGGIDVMYAQRWIISDNVFAGIKGRTGEARGAIFLWVDARDCVVERNIVIDCDSGICLGNSHRGPDTLVHCTGCVVRNNFVTRCPENGILADYTRDCRILHNTIHDPGSRLRRLIRLVHDNDGLVVANNLLSGPEMRVETSSPVRIEGNETRDARDRFVQADQGDLHLKTDARSALPRATRLVDVLEDVDGQPRAERTAIGADEPAP
jgi:nitrous oxidase accessory protein NosD